MSSIPKQGVEDARRNLPALLEQAHRGQPVIVTRHGKPYAAIVPIEQLPRPQSTLQLSALRGSGKDLWGDAATFIKDLRKEW